MKQPIKLGIVGGIIVSILVGVFVYFNSYQELNVDFSGEHTGLQAHLYKVPAHNDDVSPEANAQKENLVKDFDQQSSFRLKKGSYILTTTGGDYAPQLIELNLAGQKVSSTIKPSLSTQKLQSLLATESAAITASINSAIPAVVNGYSVAPGSLFENGEWYGTTITPKLTDEQKRLTYIDTYRLVAHKENGSWKVVTNPPEIVLSYKKYAGVPREVLSQVNKQQ